MAEDFDELTQSSDTGTDDMDTSASGYHHASLLIKQLDATSLGKHPFTPDQHTSLCVLTLPH